ncbi:MAG: FAD-dependent oxidoreductase, partial [Pseudomonadota bacterium]
LCKRYINHALAQAPAAPPSQEAPLQTGHTQNEQKIFIHLIVVICLDRPQATTMATSDTPEEAALEIYQNLEAEGVSVCRPKEGKPTALPERWRYDRARKVMNSAVNRRPGLIVFPKSLRELQSTLKEAYRFNAPISARCGGHGGQSSAVADGGVCIDLRRLKSLTVTPQTAVVGAGLCSGALDQALRRSGRVALTGDCARVGVAAMALGGGHSLLQAKFGVGCDRIRRAVLVTPEGRVIRATDRENQLVLWALRGAGAGNFGVVAEIEVEHFQPPAKVSGGTILFRPKSFDQCIDDYFEICSDDTNRSTAYLGIYKRENEDQRTAFLVSLSDRDRDDRRNPLNVMKEKALAWKGRHRDGDYYKIKETFAAQERSRPTVSRCFTMALTKPGAEAIAALVNTTGCPDYYVLLEPCGKPSASSENGAYSLRTPGVVIQIIVPLSKKTDKTCADEWLERAASLLRPLTTDRVFVSYANVHSPSGNANFASACFGDALPALQNLKRALDPHRLIPGVL